MILWILLIFGDLSLDDSDKINSYKKKCVYQIPDTGVSEHVRGCEHSAASCSKLQKPRTLPRESPRAPGETHRIPRIPMISTPQGYQESLRILWSPHESPVNPQYPQES